MTHSVRMHDERAAFLSLERLIWREGPVCPHCGETHRLGRLSGLSTPIGSWKCYACRKPFSVRHGTIFQNSHVPLHVWLQGLYLLTVSGHRLSSQKLGQVLGVSVRTAWHLKTKIAAGLAAGEAIDDGPGERALTEVVRTPVPDEPHPPEPGQAIFKARYERFLKAIDSWPMPRATRRSWTRSTGCCCLPRRSEPPRQAGASSRSSSSSACSTTTRNAG